MKLWLNNSKWWETYHNPLLQALHIDMEHEKKWPDDYVKSISVPILKKGEIQHCCNNRIIALISHCSKIILKIIAERIKPK